MYRRISLLLIALFTVSICIIMSANAAGIEPSVNTVEQVGGIVYHHNGSITYAPANGTLTVSNPALAFPLSAVNVTMLNGSTVFIGRIDPQSHYTSDYTIDAVDIKIPLLLKETIIPLSLYSGMQQQIRLCVDIENTGVGNITGFIYEKHLPPGLSKAWTAYDGGTLYVNDTVTWTIDNLRQGEKKHLAIAFNLTPSADVYFPEANIWFTYGASLTDNTPGFSGNTNTTFQIQKSNPSQGMWHVEANVPNESEFNINLDNVAIYRSSVSDPFTGSTIISYYTPGMLLNPGVTWGASLDDLFDDVPVYFIKMSYSIPYTLDQSAGLTEPAKTEPIIIAVTSLPPTPTPTTHPINPYVPPQSTVWPTISPSPTVSPPPAAEPDIVFITPSYSDVIANNTTDLETSVPPSDDPGYVIYYGSKDNKTWTQFGQSPVSGNISELLWNVPQLNGKYYLKAEHYNTWGLRGIAYTQVLIAHEILPVGLTTLLISGMDWLMLLLALTALLLMLFIILPYIRRKPIIYDASALHVLSKDKDWLSKLSKKTIRPDEIIFEIEGVDRIKMKTIKDKDEMRRFEREYGLQAYDAMALQLAREAKATLYTADERMIDICKKYDISFKQMEKIKVLIKV